MTNEPVATRMTNQGAILGLLAELYQERSALLAENTQLRADVQRLEAAFEETREHAETSPPTTN